jgi:rhodanese-related sulfurtransferase
MGFLMAFVNHGDKGCFRMKPKRMILLFSGFLIVFLCLADITSGDPEMSDAKKKDIVYGMYADYKNEFPQVRDISPQQAMALLNQGRVVFVDTRKMAEMAVSTLPGAVSQQDFLNHISRHQDKTVVAYCTISYRSGIFARDMAGKGVSIANLQGGILAWSLEGGKVYDDGGNPVKRVHVYGDKWDYPPAGYESIKFSRWEQIF